MDEGRERRLVKTRIFEEGRGLVVGQLADLGLQPRRERDDLGTLAPGFVAEGF